MQISYTENRLKVMLNRKETAYFLKCTKNIFSKREKLKKLNSIYKKALIKINKYPTSSVSKIQIKQVNNERCVIIYKTSKPLVLNFQGNIYLYVAKNCAELFDIIEKLYYKEINKSELYSYKKRYYLLCETKEKIQFLDKTDIYTKAYLEEYAKLLSNNAIKKIGFYIKNS